MKRSVIGLVVMLLASFSLNALAQETSEDAQHVGDAKIIIVNAPPGAKVHIDNKLVERVSVGENNSDAIYTMESGFHRIRISYQGEDLYDDAVRLEPNESKTITVIQSLNFGNR